MSTTLTTIEVQAWLSAFGYYDGQPHGNAIDPNFKADLQRFQADYRALAGNPDGIYGPKTESALVPLIERARAAGLALVTPAAPAIVTKPTGPPPVDRISQLRRWRLTEYWISDAALGDIPLFDPRGFVIERVSPGSFVSASLEGTIFAPDKRLLNVSGGWIAVDAAVYQPVYNRAARAGWLPDRAGYAGIRIADDKVTHAFTFIIVKAGPNGYPRWQQDIEGLPFKTIASDTGQMSKHDPAFKDKGGVIPAGTWVFILELAGMTLPDGSTHDGWVQANDTGSAIYGAHLDLFIGHESNKDVVVPNLGSVSNGFRCHLWFDGIDKLPIDYVYGL